MWEKVFHRSPEVTKTNQLNDYNELWRYIEELADNKLGYPVSLLSHLDILDNSSLGIQPHSLANVLLNNVGDPFKDSETSLMEVKKHERRLISILSKFYGMEEGSMRGYVTTGGTEGNFAGIWWSKRYLINKAINLLMSTDDKVKQLTKQEEQQMLDLNKIPINDYKQRNEQLQNIINTKNDITKHKNIVQQIITPTVFYAKGSTHYSVPKIAEIQRLNIKPIIANPDGSINLNDLKKQIMLHLESHPYSSIIVIANIGTTITGAIDDVPGIKKILDDTKSKPTYTIHLDGALTGFVMPILKPFGDIPNYFESLGANTLAVSAHKYPGLSQPCGIFLSTEKLCKKAFESSERSIDYVGNILDMTITGSRSGLNVLMFYNAVCTLGIDKNNDILTKMVEENIANARYLYERLSEIYGKDKVSHPFHFNVSFPKPSVRISKKYQLMITGEKATICVLTNANKALIDRFIIDIKADLQEVLPLSSTIKIRGKP